MNRVLVVIPHYNKIELLVNCINYLNKQDVDDFDVLIVDNGSSDGSIEYISEICNGNDRFHSILLSENMGFAIAVNKGFKFAIDNNYDYTLLLNNDAYAEKSFVKNLTNAIMNRKNRFAISSLMLTYNDKSIVDDFGDEYNILGYAFQNKTGHPVSSITKNEIVFSACGGASIYNNEIVKKIGFLDEHFFAYLEDIDFSYRARLHGYLVETCRDAACYHLGSATSGSKYNEFKVRISSRNNIYLVYKNMPNLQIAINIIPLLIGTLVKFGYFVVNGFGYEYFLGIIDGFKGLGKIKRFDFSKTSIFNLISIEIDLIANSFKYLFDFLLRKGIIKR